MKKRSNGPIAAAFAIVATFCGIYGAIFAGALVIAAKCFEYNLWSIFGRDVPWYLDLMGGLALNGANVPLAIGCAIARAMGVETPFYELG